MAKDRENAGKERLLVAIDLARLRREETDERLGHRETDRGHCLILPIKRFTAEDAEDTGRM